MRTGRLKFWIGLAALLAAFTLFRIPALGQIYHQDEYKWAQIVDTSYGLAGTVPHPPLGENAYRLWAMVAGFDGLRGLPFVVSIANLILGFFLVKRWYGERSAWWFGALSSVVTASVLGSVQIDIDGALLPFWTLIALHAVTDIWERRDARRGWGLLLVACIGGALTKLSFFLLLPAIGVEWALRSGYRPKKSHPIVVGLAAIGGVLLWASPLLNGIGFVTYAKGFGFMNLADRDYFELLLLTLKSGILLGPVAAVAAVASWREAARYRPLLSYALFQFLFYFVAFDFTHRTIERYLLAFTLPVAAIAGDALARGWASPTYRRRVGWITAAVGMVVLVGLLLLPAAAIPLHPKADFLRHVTRGDLSFLIPITGGSGPIGFFVPANVALFAFAATLVATLVANRTLRLRAAAFPVLTALTIAFSLFTTLEYGTGLFYGNASALAKRAAAAACASPDVSRIITYNDIAAWELGECGKYDRRFYLNPEFAAVNEKKFAGFDGHYVVVTMPPISPDQKIMRYLSTCHTLFSEDDRRVSARLYDCRGVAYPSSESL
ncbi:glycosyltransferase family 39 protein [Candidatus Uhrbacteria bacterium]|nr:glycosyltransferase family 39 protein [Candidatus Uhrbacteria bacterium]